ncbi:MAG: hypothetical protein ACPGN5_03270 [Porticoccaceae bacterium]
MTNPATIPLVAVTADRALNGAHQYHLPARNTSPRLRRALAVSL